MFGAIYALISIIGRIGWANKQANANIESFYRTYNPETGTYLDMYAVERKPDGSICKTRKDIKTGDLVQKDENNKIIHNFSQEKRLREASRPDSTVLKLSEERMTLCSYNEPAGIRYKDKNTGEEYIIRNFRVMINEDKGTVVYFYMRVSDATLVRITERKKRYGTLKDESIIDNFIEEFNEKQKTTKFYSVFDKYCNLDDTTDRTSPIII